MIQKYRDAAKVFGLTLAVGALSIGLWVMIVDQEAKVILGGLTSFATLCLLAATLAVLLRQPTKWVPVPAPYVPKRRGTRI